MNDYIEPAKEKLDRMFKSPLLTKVILDMIAEEVMNSSMDSDCREAWISLLDTPAESG